ncbi:hypothetical protein C497_01470 [Halalkalicoccus jeotgali B3]|uniref:Uncharacterized protein n=1 Tax=Halalkalicoccus jeotgali (strain DSM 18796 / CECT 7217 / JCM 14584 / KCTC 4019 / B3) TaxID=795797 RepID=D8JB64_HALJB|nr:hypothetical protein [Halalkalicoccus jeotgali]ADJ16517.1 hypothetical protein HacjB3_15786 [Halalkalicoccus jeotgali B3]ELY41388.1 hypothetical protein C497_01470 [Halalkalicoccus jeotgali B3]
MAVEGIQTATNDAAKCAEIKRAKATVRDRLEAGYDGRHPPFGMQFDDDGQYWVPGEEFSTALEVIDLRDVDHSYWTLEGRTGVPYSTVRRIVECRGRYLSAEENLQLSLQNDAFEGSTDTPRHNFSVSNRDRPLSSMSRCGLSGSCIIVSCQSARDAIAVMVTHGAMCVCLTPW